MYDKFDEFNTISKLSMIYSMLNMCPFMFYDVYLPIGLVYSKRFGLNSYQFKNKIKFLTTDMGPTNLFALSYKARWLTA